MSNLILLDTGPLGFITHPNARLRDGAWRWLRRVLQDGNEALVPDICDYELRRELVRRSASESIERLDALRAAVGTAPVGPTVLHLAAQLWARARNQGRPAAPDLALDGDVILAATALTLDAPLPVIIATTNPRHFGGFVNARVWDDIG